MVYLPLFANQFMASTKCIRRGYSATQHLRNTPPTRREDLSKTVFVPKSNFPVGQNPKVEISIQEDAHFTATYLNQDPSRKLYMIHDGPPYANGQIHCGHAINKILKDIAARYAMISGNKVEMIAGWDCHGLPIEMQVLASQQNQQTDSRQNPEKFRVAARAYARSQIDKQMSSFKRIGLLTDWNKRYTTDDPSYVANQMRSFLLLYNSGLIYKRLLPVPWSLFNQTTVADVDIEYKDHTSKSAYIQFDIVDAPFLLTQKKPVKALIWTTNPWTLVDNMAIAYKKDTNYSLVSITNLTKPGQRDNLYLVSNDSLRQLKANLRPLGCEINQEVEIPGKLLQDVKYRSLDGKNLRNLIHAKFVDCSLGTGLVHLAPNHGSEDFDAIINSGIAVDSCQINNQGYYTEESWKNLRGKHILSDGNEEILRILDKSVVYNKEIQHTYPYEIRTGKPVITKTSQQMFLDTEILIPKCLKVLDEISFYPENRKTHLMNCLKSRPNWCISRQRLWGTPIPVLYHKDDENHSNIIISNELIQHYSKLVYKYRFIDYWWTLSQEQLVPQEILDKSKLKFKSEELVRGTDIFDVWFDSGLSWLTTTLDLKDKNQADLYLEGYDQTRGWFQASIILSMAMRGCPPTKRIYMHGFALDKDGLKMSKSKGNVVDPLKLFETYGVDSVRLWVSLKAGDHTNVHVDEHGLRKTTDLTITKIRSTLRYLIGALRDFNPEVDMIPYKDLPIFDLYFLNRICRYASSVNDDYKYYRYDGASQSNLEFITNEVSRLYIVAIKDTLYCDNLNSHKRRSCQTVLHILYNSLLRCLYPVTPHIVHEASQYMPPSEPVTDWQDLGYKAEWKNDALDNQIGTLMKCRQAIMNHLGARFNKMGTCDAIMVLNDKKLFKQLEKTCNTDNSVFSELFKSATLILGLKEDLSPPVDATVLCEPGTLTDDIVKSEVTEKTDESNGKLDDYLSIWSKENENSITIGAALKTDASKPIAFEIVYVPTENTKCIRCWRHIVTINNQDGKSICIRCDDALKQIQANQDGQC